MLSQRGFVCISLVTNDVEHNLCVCAYWPFVYLLWKNINSNFFAHLKIGFLPPGHGAFATIVSVGTMAFFSSLLSPSSLEF